MVASSLELLLRKLTLPVFLTVSTLQPVLARGDEEPSPAVSSCISSENCGGPVECFRCGRELDEQGKYREAAEYFKKAREQEPDFFRRSIFLFNIGLEYEKVGDPDSAIPYFELYKQEGPDMLNLEFQRRREEARKMGQRKESFEVPTLEDIDRWIMALKFYSQGKKHQREMKYHEAIQLYRQALLDYLSPACRVELLKDLGVTYESNGQFQDALNQYQLYLRQAGESSQDHVDIETRFKKLQQKLEEQNRSLVSVDPNKPVNMRPVPPPVWQQHRWSMIFGGASLALVGAGIRFHYAGQAQFDDFKESCGKNGCPESDINKVSNKFDIRDALYITGGLTAVAAGGLLLREYFRSPPNHRQKIEVNQNGVKICF